MTPTPAPRRLTGRVCGRSRVSGSMLRLDVRLDGPADFAPGQFCMINLEGGARMPLSRPLSILESDGERLSLLYKVVGRGTALLADAPEGAPVRLLTPLGRPFPARDDDRPRLLLAGGVGLPPMWSWLRAHGRDDDLACFGGRDADDVPWDLLAAPWRASVDRADAASETRGAFAGNVVELARSLLPADAPAHHVIACGPIPLLRAAAALARERGWTCDVSVEERMGCGYGVCRGCVVPRADGGWWTACQDGPVLPADAVDWDRFGLAPADALAAHEGSSCACPAPEDDS